MSVEIGCRPAYAILTMVRGDQWVRALTLMDGASPYVATGATLAATVAKSIGGTALFSPTITAVNAALGQYVIDISEAQSLLLTAAAPRDPQGGHWMVISLVDADDVATTIAQIFMQVLR